MATGTPQDRHIRAIDQVAQLSYQICIRSTTGAVAFDCCTYRRLSSPNPVAYLARENALEGECDSRPGGYLSVQPLNCDLLHRLKI
jgi:hypothetical protein